MVENSISQRRVKKDFLRILIDKQSQLLITMSSFSPLSKEYGSANLLNAFDSLVDDGIILSADQSSRGISFAKGKFASK